MKRRNRRELQQTRAKPKASHSVLGLLEWIQSRKETTNGTMEIEKKNQRVFASHQYEATLSFGAPPDAVSAFFLVFVRVGGAMPHFQ